MQQLRLELVESFSDSLPLRPYATDDFSCGLKIHNKVNAVNKRYLSLNHQYITNWITFDIDRKGCVADFYYENMGAPAPNLVVENTENGHAHFLYRLNTPVLRGENASIKPVAYLANIYDAIRDALQADRAYSGLISKNPLHASWRTQELRTEPYSLRQLARNLDLEVKYQGKKERVSAEEAYIEGRNVRLFNELREWAYIEVRAYRGSSYEQWLKACIQRCMENNSLLIYMLGYNEVKSIAKSISRFTWKWDAYHYQMFIERQRFKGKIGASKGGVTRSSSYEEQRVIAKELKEQGMKIKEIAMELDVTDRTIRNWLNQKAESAPKSD